MTGWFLLPVFALGYTTALLVRLKRDLDRHCTTEAREPR